MFDPTPKRRKWHLFAIAVVVPLLILKFIPEFRGYLGALSHHWVAWMSGSVSLCIAFYEQLKKGKLDERVFYLIAAIFFVFAGFQAWQDQYEIAKKVPAERPVQIAQTINVPPATVIIQQNTPSPVPTDPTGYVQIEKIDVSPDKSTVAEGHALAFRIFVWNPGPHPVQSVHQVSGLGVVDMSVANAEQHYRELFDTERKNQMKKVALEKKRGIEIPVGVEQFKDFTLAHIDDPLTQEQAEGVLNGKFRIYVSLWTTWEDSHKRRGTLDACYRLVDIPRSAELARENLLWKTCE